MGVLEQIVDVFDLFPVSCAEALRSALFFSRQRVDLLVLGGCHVCDDLEESKKRDSDDNCDEE